jgi:hypothetical protein
MPSLCTEPSDQIRGKAFGTGVGLEEQEVGDAKTFLFHDARGSRESDPGYVGKCSDDCSLATPWR